ncbi:amidohydrolase family protein [Paenibacillus sp. NPDC058174]|uniref:amidohydrolase family protein n=1 Tax=Paenibacillus sp. NPDC058174 TaxID=3346366 RepID=UPI0036DCFEF5
MTIIDFRMKAPIPKWEKLFEDAKDVVKDYHQLRNVEAIPSNTLEEVIEELDSHDIAYAVIMGRGNEPGSSNEELADFLRSPASDRFVGFIGVDTPDVDEAVRTIETFAATGLFRGVAVNASVLQPHLPVGDASWDPIFETCVKYKLPLVLTLSVFLGLTGPRQNYDFVRPSQLYRAAKAFPEVNFIISHGAWPLAGEAIAVASYTPNIYILPDLFVRFPEGDKYLEAANFHLSGQVLYGSNYPNVPYSFTLDKVKSYQWDEAAYRKFVYENAAKLLGLPSWKE